MKLVLFPAVDEKRFERIRAAAGSMEVVNAADLDRAVRAMADADGFFGKITPELLAAAPRLRWVQAPTASLEHYLFPELVAHPCTLTNMRGLFSDVIADHVMGLVLCFARNLPQYIRQQARGEWLPAGGPLTRQDFVTGVAQVSSVDRAHQHLSDLTMGIVGVGEIGAEIARRARAFGMACLGVDAVKTILPGIIEPILRPDRLQELLRASDYVVIAAPHTPETYKMFRRPQFEQMKRTARLVNIGRGAIVDLADLTAALQDEVIAGAALDVCEVEPLPAEHPLWRMPNVIITPHVAAASPRIAERHLATLLENVRRFSRSEPLLNVADKTKWF